MGKNLRRITKQKWYNDKLELEINFNDKVEIKTKDNQIVDESSLANAYIEKNKNVEGKSQLFNISNQRGKETKIYKELKKHELECLKAGKKFKKFFIMKKTKLEDKEEELLVLYSKENIKNIKGIKYNNLNSKNKIACVVEEISEEEKNNLIKQNDYFKKINKFILNFLINSSKEYEKCFKNNEFKKFGISKYINEFNQAYKRCIKNEELENIIDEEVLYKNNKKTKNNKNFTKGEEKVHLHKYLIDCLKDGNIDIKKYYNDFNRFFYTFFNKKYELNETLNCKDGNYDTFKSKEKNLKKRLYLYNQDNLKRSIDLNEHYQSNKKQKRMELLIKRTDDEIDALLEKVYEVYDFNKLKSELKTKLSLKEDSNELIDKVNSDKIIRIYKQYYKNNIVKNFGEKKLKSYTMGIAQKEEDNEIKLFLMRLLNEYMKGRYTKARNSANVEQLTHKYLLDVYNPEKVKEKFELSLEHKVKLYKLNRYKEKVENKNSLYRQRDKLLQTYFLKLIDKIDYCSKLPVVGDVRVNDIFTILEKGTGKDTIFNNSQFLFNEENQKQFYFLEYFPNPSRYIKNAELYKNKFYNSLKQLQDLRNEVLHSRHDLNKLFSIEDNDIKMDIDFLNTKQKEMIIEKFKSNNIHKFFDVKQINQIYKNIIPKNTEKIVELNYNYYNIYLPKFDKVYKELIKKLEEGWIDTTVLELLNNNSQESDFLEKKQAVKYLFQTFYYYGFSHVANEKEYGEDKLSLEEYIIENQRRASIKGNSKKENKELIEEVTKRFKTYLKDEVKILDLVIADNVEVNINDILNDIIIKEIKYCKNNILVNLSYYLDSKHLSQLIHDTKKLLQSTTDLELLKGKEQNIISNNIEMLNLNLMYKDLVKNINYRSEGKIKEEIKKLFKDVEEVDSNTEENLLKIFKNKKELYIEYINGNLKNDDFNNYKEVKYQLEKEQFLYVEGNDITTHSGVELFLKYNLSEFLNKLLNDNESIKITKKDMEKYTEFKQVDDENISKIEKCEKIINSFINQFNKEIKNIQSVEVKKVVANKYKVKELKIEEEQYTYDAIIKINGDKQDYHYLNNKVKFNLLNDINGFIDDILSRLNAFMMYWERDANIIIEKYERDNNINTNRYAIDRIYRNKEQYNEVLEKELYNLIGIDIGDKYTSIEYDEKKITALNIRNYLSHNNYYEYGYEFNGSGGKKSKDLFSEKLSLLDLINIVHDIMSYNLKYQKDVLDVFNKILFGYRIGSESNHKNELPLKYDNKSSKIVINENHFKPRTHNYFKELNIVSEEYCKIIKRVLIFKINE